MESRKRAKNTEVKSKKVLLGAGAVAIVLIFAAGSGYLYLENRKLTEKVRKEQALTVKVTKKLNPLLLVGQDESPLLYATVSEPEALSSQAFYLKAEKDDVVFIYQQSQVAVLYRPSTEKIISVTAIPADQADQLQPSAESSPIPTPEPTPTLNPKASPSASPTVSPTKAATSASPAAR